MKAPKKTASSAPAPAKVAKTPKTAVATPATKPKPTTVGFRRIHDIVTKLVGTPHAELSMRQMAVFTTIRVGAVQPGVREISAALGINKPSITRAMDTLDTLGLIKRYADENDRRLVIAALTPKGDALVSILESVA